MTENGSKETREAFQPEWHVATVYQGIDVLFGSFDRWRYRSGDPDVGILMPIPTSPASVKPGPEASSRRSPDGGKRLRLNCERSAHRHCRFDCAMRPVNFAKSRLITKNSARICRRPRPYAELEARNRLDAGGERPRDQFARADRRGAKVRVIPDGESWPFGYAGPHRLTICLPL